MGRALRHRSNEGSHYQNSLKSVLERELRGRGYTVDNAVHCTRRSLMFYAQKHGLVERGSRLHSTHRDWVEESNE